MITSKLLSTVDGVVHGFGSAEQLVPAVLAPAWSLRPQKVQVHGAGIREVHTVRQQCGQADAFVTAVAGLPVSIISADCVPVLLARRDGRQVAAVHAGWRGLIAGILPGLMRRLQLQGQRPGDWVAAVGPAICGRCYQVSVELAAQFVTEFAALPPAMVRPDARQLDLPAIAEAQLQQLGLGDVERLPLCTACGCDASGTRLFRSYRRGDRGSQQHSGLLILK